MTVVVVDAAARMMVSDTLVVDSTGLKAYHTEKIVRCKNGALAAAAGDAAQCSDFLEWARKGCKGPAAMGDDVNGVVLLPDGSVFIYDSSKRPDRVIGGFVAIGYGASVARGAAYAGADAVKCVEAAIALCGGCGGQVIVEKL